MYRETHILTHTYLYVYNFSPKKAYQMTQVPKENSERRHPTLLCRKGRKREDDSQTSRDANARLQQSNEYTKRVTKTQRNNVQDLSEVCKKFRRLARGRGWWTVTQNLVTQKLRLKLVLYTLKWSNDDRDSPKRVQRWRALHDQELKNIGETTMVVGKWAVNQRKRGWGRVGFCSKIITK